MSTSFRSDVLTAIKANNLEKIKDLVKANGGTIYVDLLDEILITAVEDKRYDMLNYAMEMGASGKAGILEAAAIGDLQTIELIEDRRKSATYSEALHQALEHGHFDIAKWAIAAGAFDMSGALAAAANSDVDSIGTIDWLIENYEAGPTDWYDAIECAIEEVDSKTCPAEVAHLQMYLEMFEKQLNVLDQELIEDLRAAKLEATKPAVEATA